MAFHAAVEWALIPDENAEERGQRASVDDRTAVYAFASSDASGGFALAALNRSDPGRVCLDSLEEALKATEGLSEFGDRLAGYLLMEGPREDFLHFKHGEVNELVAANESVAPWLRKWIEGRHYHRIAWQARGGGYSKSVSGDGWALFRRNMVKATRVLEESWEDKPDHPGVAAELIALGLNLKGGDAKGAMRKWLGEMTEVQVDYGEGYSNVLWGLRPRWYGSHSEMIDFGRDCLESGRFDSNVPWWYLQAHRDVASEWDLPSAYFPEFRRHRELKKLFEGFENESARESWRRHDRTQAVATYFMAGKFDETKEWLDKLGGEPLDTSVLASWGTDLEPEWIVGKTEAFTGPFGKELDGAQNDEIRFRSDDALETYEKVLSEADESMPGSAREFLEHRREIVRIESEFDEGNAIEPFAPGGDGVGWKLFNVEGIDDGIVLSGEDGRLCLAYCESRVGPSFRMEGKIAIDDPDDDARIWIAFGYPQRNTERWGAVSFVWEGGNTAVLLTNAMNVPEEMNELGFGDSAEFKLQVGADGITLEVDGEIVWDNVPIPRKFVKERYARIGFCAILGSEKTRARFSNLSLER
ncbi:MAG: hypothetical protein WD342_19985 [Verrucomicrobiales bacterium]